jgi:pathogenesis-related protein 1
MKWFPLALALFALPAHAEFLDCLFFDSMDGDTTSAPAEWRGSLELHNCARKTVEPAANPPIPMMHWAADVAATAQAYANQCVFQHSGAPGLGENIFAGAPWGADETEAAELWAGEFAFYDYAANSCASGEQCGHYTQMVWRSSVELGCGIANCSANSPFQGFPQWTFVVCNYRPPGNYIGERPY